MSVFREITIQSDQFPRVTKNSRNYCADLLYQPFSVSVERVISFTPSVLNRDDIEKISYFTVSYNAVKSRKLRIAKCWPLQL